MFGHEVAHRLRNVEPPAGQLPLGRVNHVRFDLLTPGAAGLVEGVLVGGVVGLQLRFYRDSDLGEPVLRELPGCLPGCRVAVCRVCQACESARPTLEALPERGVRAQSVDYLILVGTVLQESRFAQEGVSMRLGNLAGDSFLVRRGELLLKRPGIRRRDVVVGEQLIGIAGNARHAVTLKVIGAEADASEAERLE